MLELLHLLSHSWPVDGSFTISFLYVGWDRMRRNSKQGFLRSLTLIWSYLSRSVSLICNWCLEKMYPPLLKYWQGIGYMRFAFQQYSYHTSNAILSNLYICFSAKDCFVGSLTIVYKIYSLCWSCDYTFTIFYQNFSLAELKFHLVALHCKSHSSIFFVVRLRNQSNWPVMLLAWLPAVYSIFADVYVINGHTPFQNDLIYCVD